MAWIDALVNVHALTDDDAERVRAAFSAMAANIDQWPAPATLLKFLPELPRPYFHKLPSPEPTPEEVEADAKRRRELVDASAAALRMRSYRDE
jgi:hypothetical protein